ncbi:hypothetical protein [Thermocrispum agreste]|uniref:hypothetical protein n=1 Tax=Thermocrispum agreste TaxID=37925 RepID=UPI0003FE1501|nr:hypothetical protein [Thermocrispum agreste]
MRHAEAYDNASDQAERRKALGRLVPSALAVIVVEWLRDIALYGALLAGVVAVFAGLTASSSGWKAGLVAAGVAGVVVALVAKLRRWRPWAQWVTYLAVVAVDVGLVVLMEQATG